MREDKNPFYQIKKELAEALSSKLSLPIETTLNLLERPKQKSHGHLALPVFPFAKNHSIKNPSELAKHLAEEFQKKPPAFVNETNALSGFINFQFSPDFLKSHLEALFETPKTEPKKETSPHWVIDFASPNVAKNMNLGHLRASLIGQVLVNLARYFGLRVTAINHLGDWGTQFGKLLWAYEKWDKDYDLEKDGLATLAGLYVRFHKQETPERLKEAAGLFKKLEKGDPKLLSLWEKCVQISLKNYEFYWKKLNITHDLTLGESFYRDHAPDLKNRLKKKNLLQTSENAKVVFLDKGPPCLIEKSDGASTYSARDLCSAIYRHEKLKADRLIYITGSEQKFHFQQIFETLKKMDFPIPCQHLDFGMYRFKGQGKMSTREGKTVSLESLLNESIRRVEAIIEERPLKDKKQIAENVGLGAIVFQDLMTNRTKDVDFEWNRALDFEGQSGPFVQYSHVRLLSLLKKYKKPPVKAFSTQSLSEEAGKLVWELLYFKEALYQSFIKFKPHILAGYLLDIAKQFNRFYSSERILGSPEEKDKILLAEITRRVLKTGLSLLNMPLPESM